MDISLDKGIIKNYMDKIMLVVGQRNFHECPHKVFTLVYGIELCRTKYTCRGNFFSKTKNVQTKIRPCRGDFFLKINKRAGHTNNNTNTN